MCQPHHTLPPGSEQWHGVINEGWDQEVLPQLPPDDGQQAEQLHALRRHREFQRASDLLRGLLAYVLCAPSFRQLGGWAVLIGLTTISHVAWRGHLRKARAWLLWLLCELLAVTNPPTRRASCSSMPPGSSSPAAVETTGGCIWAMTCWAHDWSMCESPIGTPPRRSNSSCSGQGTL